jgi:hypothetical protein
VSARRAIDERVERGALAVRISWANATRPTRSLASPAMLASESAAVTA